MPANNVRSFRERQMMSKAELARKAGLSTLTIDRLEAGRPCRLDTKRKVLLALGLKVAEKDLVFEPNEEPAAKSSGASPSQVAAPAENDAASHALAPPNAGA